MRRWHATRFIVVGRNRIHHRRFHDPATPRSVADVLRLDQPQKLTVNAWIRTIRKQRKFAFVELDDGSSWTSLQAVLDASQAQHLSTGAAVKVTGHLVPSPTDKEQEWELRVADIQAVGQSDAAENPIQKKYQSPEFLRSLPHLRTRTPHNALLLRLRSEAIAAATAFFGDQGFVQAHPPVITSSDCEGAGEVFTLTPRATADGASPFFREQKYLTVSSQLHLEALAQSVGRVWALAPAFRAEQSDTPRHLSEFYMLEAEMAFTNDLADIMKVVEDLIRAIAQRVRCSSAGNEMLAHNARHDNRASAQELRKRLDGLLGKPWPRITYKEAITMLHDAIGRGDVHFQAAPAAQDGLQTEHEKYIADAVGRGSPVFVTDYPQSMKPFYMAASKTQEVSELGTTAACFDLLLPEVCEVVGGSLREHSLDAIQRAMRDKGLGDAAGLEWYIDLRRYGSVPHGGFGLGFDRLLCYLADGTEGVCAEQSSDEDDDDHGDPRRSHSPAFYGTPHPAEAATRRPSPPLSCAPSLPSTPAPHDPSALAAGTRSVRSDPDKDPPIPERPASFASINGSVAAPPLVLDDVAWSFAASEPAISMAAQNVVQPIEAAEDYDYEGLPPNFSLAANMAAGAFAGIAEHAVMYPIDLLKTRMQVVSPTPAAVYTGVSNAIATISRVEGYRSLWKGVSSVIVGAGPAHAVYFATYEAVKDGMGGNETDGHHPFAAAVSGACATIASDALMNPFDVIKQRMQVHGSQYHSMVNCATLVFRTEGLRAFYISYPTTLAMTVPFTAAQFTAYESLSKWMNPSKKYDPTTHCVAGGLAGGVAAAVTTPLDVIKTLLQTGGTSTDAQIRNANGLMEAARIIKQRNGWAGFFRGLRPRIITTMPSTAICWSAYEMAKAYFITRAGKEAETQN